MTRAIRLVLGLAAVTTTLAARQAPSAPARDALVVSPAWLSAHLHDRGLVVLQVGSGFATAHIPGAREATTSSYIAADSAAGLDTELPPPDRLRAGLATFGLSDDSRIVIAFAPARAITTATRLIFTLDYAGFGSRVALLDGGVAAWTHAGFPVTSAVDAVSPGHLSPLATRPVVVDGAYVLAHLHTPGTAIVDARATAFYDGTQAGGSADAPQRRGHIAGALSLPYTSLTRDDGTLRPADELKGLFQAAGVRPGDAIVGYCHIGIQATAVLFAARTLGYSVTLYDGSFQDWSRHPDWPVDGPRH